VALVGNLVIALAYAAITLAIARPVVRSGQVRTNRLATTTALIFFSCAVGHAFHAAAAVQSLLGAAPGAHSATPSAWQLWPSAMWDLFTATVGVYYWTLRRSYGVLLGRGALFVDPEEQRRLTDITLREELATSRARSEAEREAQSAMLRAVIDSSQSLVYVKDLDGRYLMVNDAFERAFGIREADLAGRTDEVVDPGRAREWRANDVLAREGVLRVEERSTADGGRVYESVKFPLRDAAGELYATCGVSLDVTDLRRALRAAEEARDEAVGQSAVKSRFLASMSHEIRTPMNGVIGLSDLLLRTDLDDGQRRYASGIHAAASSLLDVINDILDFSKIEAGRLALEETDVELPVLVHDVAAIIAPGAQAKGLALVTELNPGVPAVLRGDPGRLRQILVNLLGNAVKFTSKGSVTLSVDLGPGGVEPAGNEPAGGADGDRVAVRFRVRDTGIGIATADLGRLFDPFTQAEVSTTRHFGGTGLGLSISRELAVAMGGSVEVESAPGRGSTFTLTVPLRRVTRAAVPARPSGPGTTDGADGADVADVAGLRVLVVGDAGPGDELADRLRRWRMAATVVGGTDEAVRELRGAAHRGRPYDVVILDGDAPGAGAAAFGPRVAADRLVPAVRVVELRAAGDAGPGEVPGATACIGKPVDDDRLLAGLASRLDAAPAPAVPEPARGALPGAGRRVLLVEDNEINQLVAQGILDRLGYRHDVAADGVEALRLAAEHEYDAILMDCQMPRMDGYAATGELRRREAGGRRTPIIAMTAGAQLSDRERCLAAGMDGYVGKPVDAAGLEAVLLRWTGGPVAAAAPVPVTATAPAAAPAPAPAAATTPVPVPAPRGAQGRVLVAEDNAINAKVAAHSLRRMGYEVHVVTDGRAALDALAAGDYDAVLMDCEMPVLDGYAATREFRRREPAGRHTPIVALTASAMAADRERCLAAGMDDYLAKPVWDEHLAAVLRRFTGSPGAGAPAGHPAAGGSDPLRRELAESYLATMVPRLEELIDRLRDGETEAVITLTHDLRPTSTVVGAYHLAELLTEVEEIARTHPDDLGTAVGNLAAEHRRVVRELATVTSAAAPAPSAP
jgi:two-component system sensor histidine kinase/response regulator